MEPDGQPRFGDQPISAFLAQAAARTATPGGGAIAMLFAAAAASMGEMTARFTVGARGADAAREAVARELADSLADARKRLLELMDADAVAFERLAAARRLPRGDDAERRLRQERMDAATWEAIAVPLNGARIVADALARLATAVADLNQNLISDAGVCAHGLLAGLAACGLNVRVNARGRHADRQMQAVLAQLEQLESVASAHGAAALAEVNRILSE